MIGLRRFLVSGLATAMGISMVVATGTVAAPAQIAKGAAEEFVWQNLRNKGEADFDESTIPKKDRIVRHEFVEYLIRHGTTIPGIQIFGISISHAIVQGEVNVPNTTIPFPLRFDNCELQGGVDFSYDKFGQDLSLTNTTIGLRPDLLKGEKQSALFIGTKVEGSLDVNGSTFYTPVNFTYAKIGSEFLSDNVHYEDTGTADFDSIKTSAKMFFRKCHFGGRVDLEEADLFSLQIEDALPAEPSATPGLLNLDINQAHIKNDFGMKNVTLSGLRAGFAEVLGPASFENVIPSGPIDLSHSHFRDLSITGFDQWIERGTSAKDFKLDGLSFDEIEIPNAPVVPSAMRMLGLIDASPYSPQPYLELERFLRNHGSPDQADETYIKMRRREREQLSLWQRPFDSMLDILVGYGKRPWRAAVLALLLVVIGTFLFPFHRMQHDDEKCEDWWYNPFWFSLDLLSPIDLGVSKKWRAKEVWRRNYAQFHRIAGWVLIPLIAAAITGIIR